MDQSIAAVKDNRRKSDTVATTSKPLGSLIQINSIAIDISCAMEEIEESPVHEHFSIRGFVAGIRKKDGKMCLPLGSDDEDVLMDNLPPLSVPKSRWWQCSHCVPDMSDEKSMIEMPITNRNDACTSFCPDVDGEQKPLFSYNVQRTGDKLESRDSGYKEEDGSPNNKMMNYSVQSVEGHKATTRSGEKTDVGDNEGGSTRACTNEANPLQNREKYQNSADASDTARVDEVTDNASSGSEGVFGVSVHRKKRKLRSLADIMYEERNSAGEHSRMRSASSSGTQAKSTEAEADLDAPVHLDVPADVPKSMKTPQKKRKSTVEEDRGPSATSPPGTVKRLRGTITDAEKTCRRIEISDSESEGNAAARLDIRHNAKTQPTKPKKNKALDISKKTRQTHIDGKTVPTREVPKVNSTVNSADLQKHAVASETDFGKMGGVPSMVGGEKEPYFMSFPSEKQMDRFLYLSKGKRPIIEADRRPLMPPGKGILGDRDIQREVALELSLNSCVGAERNSDSHISFMPHSSIPDLNESFTEKTSVMQGKQLTTVSEKRSLIPNRTLEMSASCSKEMAREGKRKPAVSQPQAVQNMNSAMESGGVSDDIPMEIVELLAKNQRDRALGNSRPNIHSSLRGPSAVYLDGRPSTFNFPARSSVSFASNEMGVSRGILNFPQAKKCQLDTANFDSSQFRLLNSFTPNRQRKMQTQYSAPTGTRPGDGSDLLWPPRSKNVPFHLSVPPNCSIQPNTLGMQSFPDHCYKGKPVNDSKGKGKIVRDAPAMKEGGHSHKSLDAYSNDTIPAMQLLSLMDRGIASGSSFKVGKSSFLDKPFAPCSHHPRLNGNENQNGGPFLNAATFSQSSHAKNFPGLLNGVCFPGEILKKPYSQGQMHQEPGHSKAFHFHSPNKAAIQPLTDNIPLGICTLNRNPADFTAPDATNEYTITAKDLKPRKRNALKERPHLANVDCQKRQRARKDASGKDLSRK